MFDFCLENVVVVDSVARTWSSLAGAFSNYSISSSLREFPGPAAIVVPDYKIAMEAVAFAAANRLDCLILPRERLSEGVRKLVSETGFSIAGVEDNSLHLASDPPGRIAGRVWLLTSGSTGMPKLVQHRWNTLFTRRSAHNSVRRRWLLPYQPGTYAWYQLICLGLFQGSQSLVAASTDDLQQLFTVAAGHEVDSLSATPTFWRLALLQVPKSLLRRLDLKTISLGGELVDQSILDQLAVIFPKAEISHVYASTEAGSSIVVKDGRSGFPAAMLGHETPDRPSLRIIDGHLWVRSPYSTCAAGGETLEWLDTGDLVEVRGDRVHFVGRASTNLINVGGNKAYPADIEAAILSHPNVSWCRVRAIRSPLVGYLPEVDFVVRDGAEVDEAMLTRHLSGKVPDYATPRFWNRLDRIPVENSLKSSL
jgi:acyl-CoA synthetase (AMP-forming)/AMP-acid ligase II